MQSKMESTSVSKLYITFDVWQRLWGWAKASSPNEVSGIGCAHVQGAFMVLDMAVLGEQSVTQASTKMNAEGYCSILEQIPDEEMENAIVWWHSHGTMKPFFSSTDESTVDELLKTMPFVLSLVINAAGETYARVDVNERLRLTVELDVHIAHLSEDIEQQCKEDVQKFVHQERHMLLPEKHMFLSGKHLCEVCKTREGELENLTYTMGINKVMKRLSICQVCKMSLNDKSNELVLCPKCHHFDIRYNDGTTIEECFWCEYGIDDDVNTDTADIPDDEMKNLQEYYGDSYPYYGGK